MTMKQNDSRQAKRIALRHPAVLKLDKERYPVELTNLSEIGCAFLAPICLEDNTTGVIEVTLTAADERFTLQLNFQVIHCFKTRDNYLIGVQFTNLSSAYQYALHQIVEQHYA